MPRASWKGFLRLSLVSCPIYLSPATTRTKSIRLHQVWQPKAARSAPIEGDRRGRAAVPGCGALDRRRYSRRRTAESAGPAASRSHTIRTPVRRSSAMRS